MKNILFIKSKFIFIIFFLVMGWLSFLYYPQRVQAANLVPTEVGFTNTGVTGGQDIAISGSYAYIISSNLLVFNISNPTTPTYVNSISASGMTSAVQIAISGNYLYAIQYGPAALYVFNISNPAVPVFVTSLSLATQTISGQGPQNISINGNYAYVATVNPWSSFFIINITNPLAPSFVKTVTLPVGVGEIDVLLRIAFSSNYAYVPYNYTVSGTMLGQRMDIYNISSPSSPSLINEITLNISDTMFLSQWPTTVNGNMLYLPYCNPINCNSSYALAAYSIVNPSLPTFVTGITNGISNTFAFDVSNYLYIFDNNNELVAYDNSNPSSPIYLGVSGGGTKVFNASAISGKYEYALSNGLYVFTLEPPCDSTIVCGSCSAPANTCSTNNGSESCNYTTYSGGGLCVLTSAPNQPCTISNCSLGNICISGSCITPTPTSTPTPTPLPTYTVSGQIQLTNNAPYTGSTINVFIYQMPGSILLSQAAASASDNYDYTFTNIPAGNYQVSLYNSNDQSLANSGYKADIPDPATFNITVGSSCTISNTQTGAVCK